jgi:pimeloyl-ACP methyl ester carboxylesterase
VKPAFSAACLLLALLSRPAAAQDVDALLTEADADSWRARWGAVSRLARLPKGDHVFKVRGALRRDPRPKVREAIAWACSMDPDLGVAILLGRALGDDPDPRVRRAAARALVHFKNRRAVSALVAALAKEKDVRTRLQIVSTLRAITPAPCLLDSGAWTAWWRKNEGDPRFVPADEARRSGEYEGLVLETKTVAVVRPRGDKKTKPPPHFLVLPNFGWSTEMFGPYLLPLRERAAISWVSLPSVQKLTGRSGYGQDIGKYPVGRLVRALDKFRASLKLDRFVILAPGATGWIAMRYAQAYPERCAGLVLIDTALDRAAYATALRRGARRGDAGERWTAKTLTHENNAPFNRKTLDRMHAYGLERGFHDRSELEIGALFTHAREPQGFASVPDIKWSKRARLDTPTIFFYSGRSAFSGYGEAERIRKHFPRALVAPLGDAKAMPWIEENEKFHAVIADWLKRYELAD